jgi:tetratricopeptide (TPR) repeat protein
MYQHRVENYYKSDVLLNEEDIFDEATSALDVPRFITQGTEKSWKNTFSLLEYIAQFAVAGSFVAWMTDDGKILHHGVVEPQSDKVAVQAYLKGRELMEKRGKEDEAKAALSKAIEKYERHALAYERRGHVNLMLKNYDDAMYDFTKSIDFAFGHPEPYFGRAKVHIHNKDIKAAIADLEQAIKNSIPLQSIYWMARRLKADSHLKLKDYSGALADLKFFSNRKFKAEDPNYLIKRSVSFKYGKVLLETGNFQEALDVFDSVLNMEEGNDKISESEKILYRGIARKKAGKTGFLKDWQHASKLGSVKADELIKDNA